MNIWKEPLLLGSKNNRIIESIIESNQSSSKPQGSLSHWNGGSDTFQIVNIHRKSENNKEPSSLAYQ